MRALESLALVAAVLVLVYYTSTWSCMRIGEFSLLILGSPGWFSQGSSCLGSFVRATHAGSTRVLLGTPLGALRAL